MPETLMVDVRGARAAGGVNALAGGASAEILVILSIDAVIDPAVVASMSAALAEPNTGIAAALVRYPDGSFRADGGPTVPGAVFAIRRETFLAAGGFVTDYADVGAETELAWKLAARGQGVRWDESWVVEAAGPEAPDALQVEGAVRAAVYRAFKFLPESEATAYANWELYRLGQYAASVNQVEAHQRGAAAAEDRKAAGLRDRAALSEDTLDAVVPGRYARRMVGALEKPEPAPGSAVAIFGCGDDAGDVILAARGRGMGIVGVFDDGYLSTKCRIKGEPISPPAGAVLAGAPLLIGGTSPGFVRNMKRRARVLNLPDPFALSEG